MSYTDKQMLSFKENLSALEKEYAATQKQFKALSKKRDTLEEQISAAKSFDEVYKGVCLCVDDTFIYSNNNYRKVNIWVNCNNNKEWRIQCSGDQCYSSHSFYKLTKAEANLFAREWVACGKLPKEKSEE